MTQELFQVVICRTRRPNVERSRLGEKSRSTGAQSFSQLVQVLRVREGAQPPHRARNPDQSASNDEIAADYVFLRDVSVADHASQCWLVGRDRGSVMFFAHAVPYKGAGVEWVAQQMARDISKCGDHGRVVLRSDQEPTLQDSM